MHQIIFCVGNKAYSLISKLQFATISMFLVIQLNWRKTINENKVSNQEKRCITDTYNIRFNVYVANMVTAFTYG